MRESGRARLPTCVVRIRCVLRFMARSSSIMRRRGKESVTGGILGRVADAVKRTIGSVRDNVHATHGAEVSALASGEDR